MKNTQGSNSPERAVKIINRLKKEYGEMKPALDFTSPFELLISTILSAQCTDARVNIVAKSLFKKYKSPQDFVNVEIEELEKNIYSTGFYRQKSKSIKNCCTELLERHSGKVPNDFELLTKLSGVGRKTASVVAGNAFGIPAIAVDTHVKRLSNLMGLVDSKNPDKIESKLKELLPENLWTQTSHLLATHGRNICIARKPKCLDCIAADLCPGNNSN